MVRRVRPCPRRQLADALAALDTSRTARFGLSPVFQVRPFASKTPKPGAPLAPSQPEVFVVH